MWVVKNGVTIGPDTDSGAGTEAYMDIPDVVTVELLHPQPPAYQRRYYLWVECNKAARDAPSGWKDVLEEAVQRLDAVHGDRDVFLVIAVGTKCMLFAWDPLNTVEQPRLSIQSTEAGPDGAPPAIWQIDQRVKVVQEARWVDLETGRLDTEHAYKIDCKTMVLVDSPGGGQREVLAYGEQMGRVEAFLVGIANIVHLVGVDLQHFA